MNYEEMGFREQYNEILFSERDVIEKFLKDQYDIRYGRQRDTWHFEPAVKMMNIYGNEIVVTDIRLDKDVFVVFDGMLGKLKDEYECFHFAYGELSKVIEALPDADEIVRPNAIDDLCEMCKNLRVDLLLKRNGGFSCKIGEHNYIIDDVITTDEGLQLVHAGCADCSSEFPTELLTKLRDHIHIEHLHVTKEYNKIMNLLALEENLQKSVDDYDKTRYRVVTFTLDKTDVVFDLVSIRRDDTGNLVIFGCDKDNTEDTITLTEKDIKREYLVPILKWLSARPDIIDEHNGHNMDLVRKINAAWRDDKYHDMFEGILHALLERDYEEYCDKFEVPEVTTSDYAMNHAHEIMEGVCDDLDLECILNFIRYEEN